MKAAGEVMPPSNPLTGPASPRRLVCAPKWMSRLIQQITPSLGIQETGQYDEPRHHPQAPDVPALQPVWLPAPSPARRGAKSPLPPAGGSARGPLGAGDDDHHQRVGHARRNVGV